MVIVMGMLPITSNALNTVEVTGHAYTVYDNKGIDTSNQKDYTVYPDGTLRVVASGDTGGGETFYYVDTTDHRVDSLSGDANAFPSSREISGSTGFGLFSSFNYQCVCGTTHTAAGTKTSHRLYRETGVNSYELVSEDWVYDESHRYLAGVLSIAFEKWKSDGKPGTVAVVTVMATNWREVSGNQTGECVTANAYRLGKRGQSLKSVDRDFAEQTISAVSDTDMNDAISLLTGAIPNSTGTGSDAEWYSKVLEAVGDAEFVQFLAAIGYFGESVTGEQILAAAKDKAKQEAEAQQQMLDSISTETIATDDYMGKIRYLALAMNDPKTNGTATNSEEGLTAEDLKKKVFGHSIVTDGSYADTNEYIWNIYMTMRDAKDPKDKEWGVISSKVDETHLICAWYCYVYFSGVDAYDSKFSEENLLIFDPGGDQRYLPEAVKSNMSVLAAAYDYLKSSVGEDIIYTDVTGVQAALTWGVRMKAAVGLANGLFETKTDGTPGDS